MKPNLPKLRTGCLFVLAAGICLAQPVPIRNPLVADRCASCHTLDRISATRGTPEGWQEVLKRMVVSHGARVSPEEARTIVKYLSAAHGLAPDEARPVLYEAERRIQDETSLAPDNIRDACAKCHSLARALAWRRSPEMWKEFIGQHARREGFTPSEDAVAWLAAAAPLHTPAWDAWSARADPPELSGRWLVTASLVGRGRFFGEMQLTSTGEGEFTSTVRLTSVNDGSVMTRTGRIAVYGGNAWRGRSQGPAPGGRIPFDRAPSDPGSETREVLVVSSDAQSAQGRWFWGQYQEFGYDVQLRRPASTPTLAIVNPVALRAGAIGTRVRLIGDNLPAAIKPADLKLGAGLSVRSILSQSAGEVVAEVDAAADASPGARDVVLSGSVLPAALAVYDRIDYLKVIPDSSMAAFGDGQHPRGYQQFAVSAFHRGPDGKAHTADDLELGPIDVNWSIEVFYAAPGEKSDHVGRISAEGFFMPATESPGANFDVWAVATAKSEKDRNGRALVGKSYMVVTVPTYTFNGRRFVRDLDRWVDDGPADLRR